MLSRLSRVSRASRDIEKGHVRVQGRDSHFAVLPSVFQRPQGAAANNGGERVQHPDGGVYSMGSLGPRLSGQKP